MYYLDESPMRSKHSKSINKSVMLSDEVTLETYDYIIRAKSNLGELSEQRHKENTTKTTIMSKINSLNGYNRKMNAKNQEMRNSIEKCNIINKMKEKALNDTKAELMKTQKDSEKRTNYYNANISSLKEEAKYIENSIENTRNSYKQYIATSKARLGSINQQLQEYKEQHSDAEKECAFLKKRLLQLQMLESDRRQFINTHISTLNSLIASPKVNK